MNNNPKNGTLLKHIDTILGELNALCAAHVAQRAGVSNPTLDQARAHTVSMPAAVKETGPVNGATAALPVTVAKAAQPVAPQTAINTPAPTHAAATVELAVEYYAANGRVAARCAATDTAHQLWERCVGELGQCATMVLHPYLPDDKPSRSRLGEFEKFYHSTTALLDSPLYSGQNGAGQHQTIEPKRTSVNSHAAKVAFSDDILPSEDVETPVPAYPVDTPDPTPLCRVLMLNSQDGAEYAWPVLYPTQWPREEAIQLAKIAVSIVKAEDRLAVQDGEPGISNYRHRLMDELRARGFVIPETDEGPLWD